MSVRSVLAEAFSSIRFYRLRAIVTILGLGWGVASFVLLMSYGQGFNQAVVHGIEAVGADLMIVWSGGRTSVQPGGMRAGRRIRLTERDVRVIQRTAPAIRAISPEVFRGQTIVTWQDRLYEYSVRGVWPEYGEIRNMSVRSGRWITGADERERKRVAVIGGTVAWELFRGVNPVGESITIDGLPFNVIGVLENKGELQALYDSDNLSVFIPYDVMSVFMDTRYPSHAVWSPTSPEVREQSIRQVRSTLASLHRFSSSDTKAAPAMAYDTYFTWIEEWSDGLGLVLFVIGAATLGIGGVGLANIMLASVKERTREIGVMKALGARRRTILAQFLAEALVIVILGGIVGLVLSTVAVGAIGSLPLLGPLMWDVEAQAAEEIGSANLEVSLAFVVTSVGVLLAVGLIAGMIPAITASRMDPVEALRYE